MTDILTIQRTFTLFLFCFLPLLGVSAEYATAQTQKGCPKIEGLIDFNCDSKIKISFLGDSIVKGVGDSKRPVQGYPGRLRNAWPFAEIQNLGVPGINSGDLIAYVKKALVKNPNKSVSLALHNSDIIVVSVGVNDFYGDVEAGATVSNIAQIVSYLKTKLQQDDGTAPLVLVGTLTFSLRPFQQPFIREVDELIFKHTSASTLPAYIRFDNLKVFEDDDLLNFDKLHPSGSGYDKMTKILKKTLLGKAQKLMASQRTDSDVDGVYDELEARFGTDPDLTDTDGDTVADGVEIFTNHTDPLTP